MFANDRPLSKIAPHKNDDFKAELMINFSLFLV